MRALRVFIRLLSIGAITLAFGAIPDGAHAQSTPDVSGDTYLSPSYGYTLKWDDSWTVTVDESEQYDHLELTNGVSVADFIGTDAYGSDAEIAATLFSTTSVQDEHVSGLAPLKDSTGSPVRGGGKNHYWLAMTYTYTDQGTSVEAAEYVDARVVVPGQAVVIFVGTSLLADYDHAVIAYQPLLNWITAASGSSEPGEPAPVFATGPWRVAVASAIESQEVASLGLAAQDGKDWVVVIADVTNWGNTDAELKLSDFELRTGTSKTLRKPLSQPASTVDTALRLASTPSVSISTGDTQRIALVYSIPTLQGILDLVRGKDDLPLLDHLAATYDASALPATANTPSLQQATIIGVSDGRTLKVRYDGDTKTRQFTLLGVDAPTGSVCYAQKSVSKLATFKGDTVWLEADPAVKDGAIPARYVWIAGNDGNKSLLNQIMLAGGFAAIGPLPSAARFESWMTATQSSASAAGVGLWGVCG